MNSYQEEIQMVKNNSNNNSEFKIRVKDLNFFYSSVQTLYDINMEIPARRVTALIGPSNRSGDETRFSPKQ